MKMQLTGSLWVALFLVSLQISSILCRTLLPSSETNPSIQNNFNILQFENNEVQDDLSNVASTAKIPPGVRFLNSKTRQASESWTDGNLNHTSSYSEEDFKSEIENFLMDEDAETESNVNGFEKIKIISKVKKIQCNRTLVKEKIIMAKKSIDDTVNLLIQSQNTPKALGNNWKLMKWMQKWCRDVQKLLSSNDFARASKKMMAVSKNIGYVQKKAASPSSKPLLVAVPKVRSIQSTLVFLSKCVPGAANPTPAVPFVGKKTTLPDAPLYLKMEGVENSANALTKTNGFDMLLNKNTDTVRLRSINTFENGIFSITLKCPSNSSDLIIRFLLSSSDDVSKGQKIAFTLLGFNTNRARAATFVDGSFIGNTIDFGWDCSAAAHKYTIIRDTETISWLVDEEVVRTITKNDPNSAGYWVTDKSMRLYVSVQRQNTWGWGSNRVVSFTNLRISPSLNAKSRPTIPYWPISTIPLSKFGIDYCDDTISRVGSELVIPWGLGYCYGGRIISPKPYHFGTFSAQIKCPMGNSSGLVTGFYLSSYEGGWSFRIQDEIDFEFLGKDRSLIQATVFVNGQYITGKQFDLGFDCSKDFHTYTIDWSSENIQWFVDGKWRFTYINDLIQPYPVKPSYLYSALWMIDGPWAGKYYGLDNNKPFLARYKNIQVRPRTG